ncbi:MAG: hypothetical protein ACLGG6_01190 [Gammaproteobacteria bacterium]
MMRLVWLLGALCAGAAQAADMTVLRFVDQDPGDPPYLTRVFVTPAFMRMDDGSDDGDFVLLDRRANKVVNVMRGNRMAMVFTPGKLPAKPAKWKPRLDVRTGAPGTRRFVLSINGEVCSEGVAAQRAAPDAARALAEFKSVLAATQYRVWQDSPREVQHDCDLANQVWESGATLKLGLPLEEREFTGRSRRFESEVKEPVRPELFRVPADTPEIAAPS